MSLPDQKQMLDHLIQEAGPTSNWHGRCFGLATILAKFVGGTAVYGHYTGPVSAGGYWGLRAGQGFHQHGWVLLEDMILDPTRWSFENEQPYIAVFDELEEEYDDYDEGGNNVRRMLRQPFPVEKVGDGGQLYLDPETADRLEGLAGQKLDFSQLGYNQVMWLGNLTPEELGTDAQHDFYQQLEENDLVGVVPLDNWRAYKRGR